MTDDGTPNNEFSLDALLEGTEHHNQQPAPGLPPASDLQESKDHQVPKSSDQPTPTVRDEIDDSVDRIDSLLDQLKNIQPTSSPDPTPAENIAPTTVQPPDAVEPVAPIQPVVPVHGDGVFDPLPGAETPAPLASPSGDGVFDPLPGSDPTPSPPEEASQADEFDPLAPASPVQPQTAQPAIAQLPPAFPERKKSPAVAPAAGINEYTPDYEVDEEEGLPEIAPPAPASGENLPPVAAYQPPVSSGPAIPETTSALVVPGTNSMPSVPRPDNIEASDLLWAISFSDPASTAANRENQLISNIREESRSNDADKKKNRAKIKFTKLPFQSIIPGTPLMAAIFSPSGGTGKSSLSMNLAVYIAVVGNAMAKQRRETEDPNAQAPRVLVLDGDVVHGTLALRLKGELSPSLYDLILYADDREESGFVDEQRWPTHYDEAPMGEKSMRDFVMWPDNLPNLNLLAAPPEPDLFFDLSAKDFQEVLKMLGKFYDVIIIDSGTEIVMNSNRTWVQNAHELFLVATPEIDRIFNASKQSRYITKPRKNTESDSAPDLPPITSPDKMSVVMNRANIDVGLNIDELIKESFPWADQKSTFKIPDMGTEMTKANNKGEFIVLQNREFAEAIGQIASRLFARYSSDKQRAYPDM